MSSLQGLCRPVLCPECRWEGDRRYVTIGDPLGTREGYGTCPRCQTKLVDRPPKYVRGQSKLASLPSRS